jgi:heptosyltransferase-2
MESPGRMMVLLPNWVGDAIMATPALTALRRCFGDEHILLVGKPIILETLSGLDLASDTCGDLSTARPKVANFFRTGAEIRRRDIHLAILLPNSLRAALLARWSGAKRVLGYARYGRGWLLTDKLHPPREGRRYTPTSTMDAYNALVGLLGVEVTSRKMSLVVTPDGNRQADEVLAQCRRDPACPLVMLNPGASFGPSKMWETTGFAAVADALTERHGAQIVINCSPAEKRMAAEVASYMKRPPLLNFADRDNSISLLKAMVSRCRLMITNDTGARHVAAALGIDVVTIFCSTDPRWAENYYDRERTVIADVPCSPCQSKFCMQPAGPLYQQCTASIKPETVLAAAEELLAAPRASASPGPAPAEPAPLVEARP